jgi:peptide deformylase
MSELLQIIKSDNPILSQKAQPIKNIDLEIQQLIHSLIDTAAAANGVGIAAPQVSRSCRLFVMSSRPNERYPNAPLMEPTAIINPTILNHSSQMIKGWEGCLSCPGMRGLVPRYETIEVEYIDYNGRQRTQILSDFIARIFQHELDHLDGILFPERLESQQDLFSESEYQKIIAHKQS